MAHFNDKGMLNLIENSDTLRFYSPEQTNLGNLL